MKKIKFFLLLLEIFFLLMLVLPRSAGADDLEKCIEFVNNTDYSTSARCFKALADKENIGAYAWLGYLYANGKGLPQNYGEAARWFEKAALHGHKESQNLLGNLYRDGKGVKQDYTKAAKWYSKAAEQGLPAAQSELGVLYLLGKGVPQDYEGAVIRFKKAASQGFVTAQINLAYCYQLGKGVPMDYDKAMKWLNLAAEKGSSLAKVRLSEIADKEGKMKAPSLTDSEYLSLAHMAQEKYKDCSTALDSYLEISELGRKDPEWSLSIAKAYECVKNYPEALYYYKKYASFKPGQKWIAEKQMKLQSLIVSGNNRKTMRQATPQSTITNNQQNDNCLEKCSQSLIKCGLTAICQKAFSSCKDKCQNSAIRNNALPASGPVNISEISYKAYPDHSRVVIRLSDKADFTKSQLHDPERFIIDLKNCRRRNELKKAIIVGNDKLKSIRNSQFSESTVRIVLDLGQKTNLKVFTAEDPMSIVIEVY